MTLTQIAPAPRSALLTTAASLVSTAREAMERSRATAPAGEPGDAPAPRTVGTRVTIATAVGSGGDGPQISAGARAVAAAYGIDLDVMLATEDVTGSAGEVVRVPVLAPAGLPERFLLIGTGRSRPQDLRRAGAALAGAVRGQQHCVTNLGDGAGVLALRAAVEGLLLGAYAPPSAGLKDRAGSRAVQQITLAGSLTGAAVDRGRVHAQASLRARDLAHTPSNIKTPAWLADQAVAAGAESGLRTDVWDVARLQRDGFGGILAVGSGSADEPRFVRLDYRPTGPAPSATSSKGRRPIVLVGKGITYDTGGISIKPRESMVPMKTDMSGAAAVLAAICACRELGISRPVTALLPIAQNSFGASSYRPADVIRVYGGRTVEILNTDAEGRIVLADAMAYAVAKLDPEVIVDLATLTGAATLGLGRRNAALYATNDRLASAFSAASDGCGEGVWRMPLVDEYRRTLDSPIADLRHVPVENVGGGSITAALFLREFTGGRPWVHLDIAGTGRSDRDDHEIPRGATGFGARLLLRWLEALR